MGVNALRSHMRCTTHKSGMRGREQLAISTFCAAATVIPQNSAAVQTSVTAASTADLRVTKAGPFVMMIDESLSQSSKKKQLDIHVQYWEDGCVQSRYFGSQFLGHGRADDLLHHIKVILYSSHCYRPT